MESFFYSLYIIIKWWLLNKVCFHFRLWFCWLRQSCSSSESCVGPKGQWGSSSNGKGEWRASPEAWHSCSSHHHPSLPSSPVATVAAILSGHLSSAFMSSAAAIVTKTFITHNLQMCNLHSELCNPISKSKNSTRFSQAIQNLGVF
jgi:hypothetical protein